ncbi:MAG: group I truncated hemoglobin [Nitrospinales bacterium]
MTTQSIKLMASKLIFLLAFFAVSAIPYTSFAEEKSLYQRLGGYDAISAVVNEFADRLVADKNLERFFGAMSTDSIDRFKQANTMLVCAATGGPCNYLGRSMGSSHEGMGVKDAHFNAVAGHLVATLDKFNVPAAEKDELVGIIGGLKGQIVE